MVQVLHLVDGDGSTAGYLYEAMERVKKSTRHRCGNNQAKYMKIWELFEYKRGENIIHSIHAVATFFNPSYMCSDNFREDHEMKEGISYMLTNLVLVEENEDFMKTSAALSHESLKFIHRYCIDNDKNISSS